MKKKRLYIILSILLIVLMTLTAVACTEEGEEPDPGEVVEPIVLTPGQALDRIYDGLLDGGDAMASMSSYGVENVYTVYMNMLNYTITYKANYRENYADSEIYISVFDNQAYLDRITAYYDGADLYFSSQDKNYVLSDFSTSMMFNVFYELCMVLDMSGTFFSEEVGTIFDRNNNGINLSLLLDQRSIKYNKVGENSDLIELTDLDLSVINDTVSIAMDSYFRGIGDKFDILTQKFLDFRLSRLLETRFSYIYADTIAVKMTDKVATDTNWVINGSLQDSSKYEMTAKISYNGGSPKLAEGNNFIKSNYIEASVGKNHFYGSVLIPAISDERFDADIVTNINTVDNRLNESSLKITDAIGNNFLSAYYRGEHAFVDATGFYEWMGGAIELDAFNLPKVYFDNINLTKLINASYNNLIKALLILLEKGSGGEPANEDLYDIIMENFYSDGKSVIYYKITEELIQKISQDDTSLMTKVAELLGVDENKLASYIGEDFFSSSEVIIGYNLDTGEIIITMNQRGNMLFEMNLKREPFTDITFPDDANVESSAYSKLVIPDAVTMEIEATLKVFNQKTESDLSKFLGVLVGDISGNNTKEILKNTEALFVKGSVSERYVINSLGESVATNTVSLNLYKRKNNVDTLIVSVNSNPNDANELLIAYYLPMGDFANPNGLFYRLNKRVVRESFDELLEGNNIFGENSILTILDAILNSDGITTISKIDGWFEFSLVVNSENDPVYDLIGIKDTTAAVRARILFTGMDANVDPAGYIQPTITALENITIDSIYSDGSAWKDAVEVIINSSVFRMKPNYQAESVEIKTGVNYYNPKAFLFGQEITYRVDIKTEYGTYRVDRLPENILRVDPTYDSKLPKKIEVIYDNGETGLLDCYFVGFEESNITYAGYNLAGFAGEYDSLPKYKVIFGDNSIMRVEFEIYILVYGRNVLPTTDSNGIRQYDDNGVPVVGTVNIDPYTYAMRRTDEQDYNPITDGISSQDMELCFDGTYGYEMVDNETEKVLSFDILGVNRYKLAELGLEWEYDLNRITWQGSFGYAYAYFGDKASGQAVKIAVKVNVSAQTAESVQIDDALRGSYTIDFLMKSTYTVPTQTGVLHEVKIYFRSSSGSEKFRIVSAVRPDGISDETYYNNYIKGSLEWENVEQFALNPSLIKVNGTNNLFGNGNRTNAVFGQDLGVGEQEVGLDIVVPSRYQSSDDTENRNVANICVLDEFGIPSFTTTTISMSKAHFPKQGDVTYGYYDALLINPYDRAMRLPQEIYLNVADEFSENATRSDRKYPITWVTTDDKGNELNLIEEKEDGGYGLKYPVTYMQDMAVYGKVGDRGGDDGYIWITMSIRNLASELISISYDGLEDGQTTIYVDPYLDYTLPNGFTAVLENGESIVETDIQWFVTKSGENDWYPINYVSGAGFDASYYKDGKYVFNREGGLYVIRYIIDGGGEIIRQELTLEVMVSARTLESGLINIYNDGEQPSNGYSEINYYLETSAKLFDRLSVLATVGGNVGLSFKEAVSASVYELYSLPVDWVRAEVTGSGYENSLDRLLALLSTASAEQSMVLHGTIWTGTVNEQQLEIRFSFANLTVNQINLYNLAVSMEKGAVSLDESESNIVDFSALGSPKTLNIQLNKPFGITAPDGEGTEIYASPYTFINYLFNEIMLEFVNGTAQRVKPVIDFGDYNEQSFNTSVLLGQAETLTTFRLSRLSDGSAIDEIIINLHSAKDTKLDSSADITAELFNEDATELFADSYTLPEYIDVNYELSGRVRYNTAAWQVSQESKPYLNTDVTSGIPVELINTLRLNSGNTQATTYRFYYNLPCVNEDYYLSVYIPKKNIQGNKYSAEGETSLYNLRDGVLNIDNPYLYYDSQSEYGLDITKIPSVIRPTISADYVSTQVNTHYVSWSFRSGVFTTDLFRTGAERLLFATAVLPAYFDEKGNKQSQTVNLYITVKALSFSGINYLQMPVTTSESGLDNVVEIDPYNDVMGYRGTFVLPTNGLTVLFNGGADRYVFDNVTYRLRSANGAAFDNYITTIPYDEKGHSLTYENLRPDGILELNMYIPGYDEDGILIYVNILSRIIEEVNVPNNAYQEDGTVTVTELPSLYYIDPYNNSTFMLPDEVSVKFRENNYFTQQTVAGWEININGTYVSLDNHKNFYSRESGGDYSTIFGFYQGTDDSYKGGVYSLRGYISLGRTSTGIAGRQNFNVTVVVLNRSLKTEYSLSYRYDDPMGGLLSDIPNGLNADMFVAYDNYYAEYGIEPEHYYSAFSIPAVPEVNWSVYNDDSVIDYKGGFDKELKGNVYANNQNKQYNYKIISDDVNARFNELIKARMWDAYFTAGGTPQAYYTENTTRNLTALAAALENEVIFATYEITVNIFNDSELDAEKQYGNYMANGLINEITAETGMDATTEMAAITVYMFNMLKAEYDLYAAGGDLNVKAIIYENWKKLYDEFKAAGSDTNAELSVYQQMKTAKYDYANRDGNSSFTNYERENYNKRLHDTITKNLKPYINAEIWDSIYDRALNAERKRMEDLINGNTVTAKSNALTVYLADSVLRLGCVGEVTFVNVTAPTFEIGNILDEDGNILTQFLFNVYSTIAFMAEVEVEVVLNYTDFFDKYITEGMRLALDDYRSTITSVSLTEFVKIKTAEFVNAIVPMTEIENTGGQMKPIIDFTYADYLENNSENSLYWKELYEYRETNAVEHLERLPGNTTTEYWNAAYAAHRLNGETDMTELMDGILKDVMGNGEITDKYGVAFDRYKTALKAIATADMDLAYAEALKDANVSMTDAIYNGSSIFSQLSGQAGGFSGLFSKLYGSIAVSTYDLILNSYATNSSEYTEITQALSNANSDRGGAVYLLMTGVSVSGGLQSRARDMFNWKIGGAAAFDALYENASLLNLTKSDIDRLSKSAEEGSLNYGLFNNAFGDRNAENAPPEDFISYSKYVLFVNIANLPEFAGSLETAALLKSWSDAALREAKAEAYERLYNYYVTGSNEVIAKLILSIREDNFNIKVKAFARFVGAKEEKGANVQAAINERYGHLVERAKFDSSKRIYEALLANDGFKYKDYLTLSTEEQVAAVKSGAVSNYYNNYASVQEKTAIDYHRTLANGDAEVYDVLFNRTDLGEGLTAALSNAYYRAVLDDMLIKVREKIENSEINTNDAEYRTIWSRYNTVFGVTGDPLTTMQTSYRDSAAKDAYRQYLFDKAIAPYTELHNGVATLYRTEHTAVIYEEFYRGKTDGIANEATFDAILKAEYDKTANNPVQSYLATLQYDAYLKLKELLLKDELSHYYEAVDYTVNAKAKETLYEAIGKYSMSKVDAEGIAKSYFDAWAAVYDSIAKSASPEEISMLNEIIDPSAFVLGAEETYLTKLTEIETIYLNVSKLGEVDRIQNLLNAFLEGIDEASKITSGVNAEERFASEIKHSIGQNLFRENRLNKNTLDVQAVVGLVKFLYKMVEVRKAIDAGFKSSENLLGDYGESSLNFKAAYVDGMITVLSELNYTPAVEYLNNLLESFTENWFDMNGGSENYAEYEREILARIAISGDHAALESNVGEVTVIGYVQTKTAYVEEFLKQYIEGISGTADAEYEKVFAKMKADVVKTIIFYTEDNLESLSGVESRHMVIFDKSDLVAGTEDSSLSPVYLANAKKVNEEDKTNIYKLDGIRYQYIQIQIKYVDFGGEAYLEGNSIIGDGINAMTIDPLEPLLPDTVHAFGEYTLPGSSTPTLYDVGMVRVRYGDTFYDNIYNGLESDSISYQIYLKDSNEKENVLNITVSYLDRTVQRIYLENRAYGGAMVSGSGAYNGYFDIYDDTTGTNTITIDPINADILDTVGGAYNMPENIVVNFADDSSLLYRDVVWDMSSVRYSLEGQQNVPMRILSYRADTSDGSNRLVVFDYGTPSSVEMRLYDADGNLIRTERFFNAPSFAVWNVNLTVKRQTIETLSYYDTTTGQITPLGNYVTTPSGSYIDLDPSLFTVNPFDIEYPPSVLLTFYEGSTVTVNLNNWRMEPGNEGTFKLNDIILGIALDHNLMANFTYLGYTVRVRMTADDIELEGLESGEYFDGGVLYLIRNGGSAAEQLQKNYSHLYYNFSGIASSPDYRKIPLSFQNSDINYISINTVREYTDVKGILGWDKINYPDMVMSPNIRFTVSVIDPVMYASLNGEINPFVSLDYISMPYDSNFQKKNDSREPESPQYFVQTGDEENAYFKIIKDTVQYDILGRAVYYECEFGMTSTNAKIAASQQGGRTMKFGITVPLECYLFTGISGVYFDSKPEQTPVWSWTTVDKDSNEYRDAIYWPLGRSLKASDLPKAYTENGELISLFWDLSEVNINRATDTGYTVYAYYYDADSMWNRISLIIYIEKVDISTAIINNLGGYTALERTYNGNYFKLPLDLTASAMRVLRDNGRLEQLSEESVLIEYKGQNADDREYSVSNYPLNAGTYSVRVRVDDYNAVIVGELVFTLTIKPYTVRSQQIVFENDTNNNIIYYDFDGTAKNLKVSEGLPMVRVDNWFASLEEKEALVNEQISLGFNSTTAKSRAYNELYRRVTAPTKNYMDALRMQIRDELKLEGELLNCAVFDRLDYGLQICEVNFKITYSRGDTVLSGAPTDVGAYTARLEILADDNNGNYVFDAANGVSRFLEIQRPEFSYSVASNLLTYNGRLQNPLINDLHDANGNLPAGVEVIYTYSYVTAGVTHYLTGGVTNVGSYLCEIRILGGNNYPSEALPTFTLTIKAQDLHIDLENTGSLYLNGLADVSKAVKFNGLAGYDTPSNFGYADVVTDAKDYFTLGTYGMYLSGFKIDANAPHYYTYFEGTTTVIDGREYYRFRLKNADQDGSLYAEVDAENKYVYADMIALFSNYNVYVLKQGDYIIYAEDNATVVGTDEELAEALNSVRQGDSAKIYLKEMLDDEGNIIPYKGITIDFNAEVSIIGCYDEDRNIMTYIENVTIVRGAVNLRILGFNADAYGGVSINIEDGANAVSIYDCNFSGNRSPYSVAIKTDINYVYKLYVSGSSFTEFSRGINLLGGNMELNNCEFINNTFGVSVTSKGNDVRISRSNFNGNSTGVYTENIAANLLYNTFGSNRTAVKAPGSGELTIISQNTFEDTNGVNIDVTN